MSRKSRFEYIGEKRRPVASLDRPSGALDPSILAIPLEVGAELFPTRGARARHPLEPQKAHRDLAPVWDSRLRETPAKPGVFVIDLKTSSKQPSDNDSF